MTEHGDTPGGLGPAVAGFEFHPHMILVAHGPELDVVAVNAAARGWFPDRPMVGLRLTEAFAELMGQQLIDLCRECYRTGEPRHGTEWRMAVDTGGAEPTEMYVDFAMAPWRDETGDVVGVVCDGAVVTDRVNRRMVAEQAALAADARYRNAMAVVSDFQSALLPEGLPVIPGLELAAGYLLAAEDIAAGGDWFDAVVRPGGSVALVVGDVVGHGVQASAVMGQLRAVLHQRLLGATSIAEALRDLDQAAAALEGGYAATACVVEIDPRTGTGWYCTAGHPPPLVVSNDGTARFLAPTGAGPLATGTDFRSDEVDLAPGELVFVYSDGLVERPQRSPAQNTVEVLDVVSNAFLDRAILGDTGLTAQRVCEQSLELLTRVSGYTDDITVLAAQRVPAPEGLHLRAPARPENARRIRQELTDWLSGLAVRDLDQLVAQHAVGELVTNVIEHAYTDEQVAEGAEVEVSARVVDTGHLVAMVSDTGSWRTPESADHGGRGLGIAADMADDLAVDHGERGTVATMRHRLSRPARLLTGSTASAAAFQREHADPDDFSVDVDDDAGTVEVGGVVDAVSGDDLRRALMQATRGGTTRVRVDLSRVTLLMSVGVQVLHELVGTGQVQLVAPAGSPAHHVLDLVGLPCEPDGGPSHSV